MAKVPLNEKVTFKGVTYRGGDELPPMAKIEKPKSAVKTKPKKAIEPEKKDGE